MPRPRAARGKKEMPNFSYFATFDESIKILTDLCSQGFLIIAEPGPFDEPKAPSFDQMSDELVAIFKFAPVFYLAGDFTHFPTQFFSLKSGSAEGKYAINLEGQGPLMQSIIGRVSVVNGTPSLLPGDVSYQSEYKNPETGKWEKASAEVKAAYRKSVSIITRTCVRYYAGTEIFIGPEALKLFESGKVEIKDHRKTPPTTK